MAAMTVAEHPDERHEGETPSWAWPVHAFVAWLAAILGYITRFKRARRFRSDWRDCWEGLRESEWHRDQLIAQGLAQLIAGQPLQPDDTKIELTAPASYGGPCPATLFEMNRRFLALARWAADPEAIIRERFRRLGIRGCPLRRAARATSPSLRLEEENGRRLSSSGATRRGRWHARSCARAGGCSRRLALNAQPRAPPAHCLLPTAHCLGSDSFRDRGRMPDLPLRQLARTLSREATA